jgi:hypothetical protein
LHFRKTASRPRSTPPAWFLWVPSIRSATLTGNGFAGADGDYDANGKKNFFIPELGYNRLLTPKVSLGVSMYGNGGMDTLYATPRRTLRLLAMDLRNLRCTGPSEMRTIWTFQ